MSAAISPAPWKFQQSALVDARGEMIAAVMGASGEDQKLIAAAPDLAESLKQLAQYCEATGNPSALDWARSARATLAKAGL